MRSTKRQATEELPSMSNLDIEVFFGWDRIGIGTAVTRGKFPASHLTPTGEYLWMRSDVERWARERNLPDLEQAVLSRSAVDGSPSFGASSCRRLSRTPRRRRTRSTN